MHHYQQIDAFIAEYGIELYLGFLGLSMVLIGLILARHTLRQAPPPTPVVVPRVGSPPSAPDALPPHLVPPKGVGGQGSLSGRAGADLTSDPFHQLW